MKNDPEFNKWFIDVWKETEGAIQYSIAAKIIGCSKSYITQLINENKLKNWQYKNTNIKFVSRNEILEFKSKINYEKSKKQ